MPNSAQERLRRDQASPKPSEARLTAQERSRVPKSDGERHGAPRSAQETPRGAQERLGVRKND